MTIAMLPENPDRKALFVISFRSNLGRGLFVSLLIFYLNYWLYRIHITLMKLGFEQF
jgi:hypothetical protein